MPFIPYNKIYALHKSEVEGILGGWCTIQEKIDGANTSIWLDKEKGLCTGSRNQEVTGSSFRGFSEYVAKHEGVQELLKEFPQYHLYGEWLVPHTIQYKSDKYSEWYMFDILNTETMEALHSEDVYELAEKYGIRTPHYFGQFKDITIDELKEMCGKSELGEHGEGIVIKNHEFVNQWGHKPYAKLVTEKFKESNGIVFGGNNKQSDSYHEMYVVNKYCTLPRIKKIMQKVNSISDREIDERNTSEICSRTVYDIITEDGWEIFNKVPQLDNRKLKSLLNKKIAKMYKDILSGFESVAYEE